MGSFKIDPELTAIAVGHLQRRDAIRDKDKAFVRDQLNRWGNAIPDWAKLNVPRFKFDQDLASGHEWSGVAQFSRQDDRLSGKALRDLQLGQAVTSEDVEFNSDAVDAAVYAFNPGRRWGKSETSKELIELILEANKGKRSELMRDYMQQFENPHGGGGRPMGRISQEKLHRYADRARHDHSMRGCVYEFEIDLDKPLIVGKGQHGAMMREISIAFGLSERNAYQIIEQMHNRGLHNGGRDGEPFCMLADFVNHNALMGDSPRAKLEKVDIVEAHRGRRYGRETIEEARANQFDNCTSVTQRPIDAYYTVSHEFGRSEIKLNFAPGFFRSPGESGVVKQNPLIKKQEEQKMNKSQEFLNLIDESFTTVLVDLNYSSIDTKKETKANIKASKSHACVAYKVQKDHALSPGDLVIVERSLGLHVGMISEIHDEPDLDTNPTGWVVDVVNTAGIIAAKARDKTILKEIKQKEKLEAQTKMREHVKKSLGIGSLNDIKGLAPPASPAVPCSDLDDSDIC